jgi:hypothetical protein
MRYNRLSRMAAALSALLSVWMYSSSDIAFAAQCEGKSVAACADLLAKTVDDLRTENISLKERVSKAETTIENIQKNALRVEASTPETVIKLAPGSTGRMTFKKPFNTDPMVHASIAVYVGGNVSTPTGSYLRYSITCQGDKIGITCKSMESPHAAPSASIDVSWMAVGN